jgi:hypothetical protein
MMPHPSFRIRNLLVTVIAFAAVAVVMASLWAAETKSPTASITTPPTMSDSTKLQQDSLFARIDQDFKLIEPILKKSCFDCHSNTTRYPWYYKLPIIKGMIDDDIKIARRHVDFSDGFPFKSRHEVLEILHDIKTEVSERDMPTIGYRIMHSGALLEGPREDSVLSWVDRASTQITSFFDSHGIPYKKQDSTKDSSSNEQDEE